MRPRRSTQSDRAVDRLDRNWPADPERRHLRRLSDAALHEHQRLQHVLVEPGRDFQSAILCDRKCGLRAPSVRRTHGPKDRCPSRHHAARRPAESLHPTGAVHGPVQTPGDCDTARRLPDEGLDPDAHDRAAEAMRERSDTCDWPVLDRCPPELHHPQRPVVAAFDGFQSQSEVLPEECSCASARELHAIWPVCSWILDDC